MTETIVTPRKEEEPEPEEAPGTEEEREAPDRPDDNVHDDEEAVPAA